MGVCLPYSMSSNKGLFLFLVLPNVICCCLSFLFLVAAIYYLRREVRAHRRADNTHSVSRMMDLMQRFMLYGVGVFVFLTLATITALKMFVSFDDIKLGAEARIVCRTLQASFRRDLDCQGVGYTVDIVYFALFPIAALLGVGAQNILSCHSGIRNAVSANVKKMLILSGGQTHNVVKTVEMTGHGATKDEAHRDTDTLSSPHSAMQSSSAEIGSADSVEIVSE